jgi:thioredoxin-related protein
LQFQLRGCAGQQLNCRAESRLKDGGALEAVHTCAADGIDRPLHVKNWLLSVLLAFALLSPVCARAENGWATDYKKAQEEAKSTHKLLLLNFTGSDWCGYCIQLDRAILSQPQFKEYAGKNLILTEIDYPRRGGPKWNAQSTELKKQNMELAERYQIEGFPTLVVLNGDGKTVWRYDGYFTGGVAAFLAELDKVRKG